MQSWCSLVSCVLQLSATPPLSALPAKRKCVLQLQREAVVLLAVVCSVVCSAHGAATRSAHTLWQQEQMFHLRAVHISYKKHLIFE